MKIEFSLNQIDEVVAKLLTLEPKKIILFNGDMGAGKTTLIKAICKKLGVENATSSPTFSLVNEYQTTSKELIYHFDVYRLKNQNEALDIGIDDYLYSGNRCFIEWSEKIIDLIPKEHSTVNISVLENGNRILVLE